jgi:hypothetical protein
MTFYSDKAGIKDLSRGEAIAESPLFISAVHKSAYSTERWGSVLLKLPKAVLPEIPCFFRQDPLNPENCEIFNTQGETRSASPSECAGIERSAVWSAEHVESRLTDSYAGRPNAFVESLRVKV